jgi:hypothetical protein
MAAPQARDREAVAATYAVGMVGVLAILVMGILTNPEKMPQFFQIKDPVFGFSIATHVFWLLLFSFLFILLRIPTLLLSNYWGGYLSAASDLASLVAFALAYLPFVMNILYLLSTTVQSLWEMMLLNPVFGAFVVIFAVWILRMECRRRYPSQYKVLMDTCRRRLAPLSKWLKDASIWLRTVDQ